ncbi:DNA primase small subunit-like isoform X2 [Belonocnema kinseyi]|uniref:DNA primase small subunit-like isoform X2 n=1 Tax=Belonocnema kinseyi TaxID=2817044 RepID=UPI00143DE80C|nr:DNA primase small subunit-like isoform X2 [Belonocnema kinseyi]
MSIVPQRMFYYWNHFPFEDCCRWLSYGNGYILSLREVSFGISDGMFFRNLSFNNALDFKLNARRINPERIDLGPVYNISPALAVIEQSKSLFKQSVTQREVVFDIDISDYEEVRTCCIGSNLCRKCWKYMAIACKVIDLALREDFGYCHILWTYSGGRGVHCWVCDEEARKLKPAEREAVGDYLQIIKSGAFNVKKVHFEKVPHPSVKALQIIEPEFVKTCVEEQNILGTEEGMQIFLRMISSLCNSETVKEDLKEIFDTLETSGQRWKAFLDFFKKTNEWRTVFVAEELMIQYFYPRLDIGVTKVLNHLLKCPFSPHNKTQKICIPFDVEKVDDFDPTTAPNIPSLFAETQLEKAGETNLPALTKFREGVQVFQKFVSKLEKYKCYA